MSDEKIFVGQEALQLILETNTDISEASGLKIKYRKPGGTEGFWAGTLNGTTQIKKDFIADEGELDEKGKWTFWAFCIMSDGRDLHGKPVTYVLNREGRLEDEEY